MGYETIEVTVPDTVADWIKKAAAESGVSENQIMTDALWHRIVDDLEGRLQTATD